MLVLGSGPTAWAASLRVTSKWNDGPGSLREAITIANQNGEPDTISFEPAVAIGPLRPRESFPALTEDGTRIDGDVDGDGTPDVLIDGSSSTQTWACGLVIRSDDNVIAKLIINGFAVAQVVIQDGSRNIVRNCRIGTSRDGTSLARGGDGVWVIGGEENRIGAPGPGGNLIAGAVYCVAIMNSVGNRVANNYIGTDITGTAALATRGVGVAVLSSPFACHHNVIGGTRPRDRNVMAGPTTQVLIDGRAAHHNRVMGNYLDLKADGSGPMDDRRTVSVQLGNGARQNTIGGERPDGGNVIWGGIKIQGANTDENHIIGNYIGLNAQGLGSYRGPRGILVTNGAGKQYIGGETPEEGNYVCGGVSANAVEFLDGGKGSIVRNNVLGANVLGEPSGLADGGVVVYYTDVWVEQNQFIGLKARGVYVHDGRPVIVGNTFSRNPAAVIVGELAKPNLGNLENRRADDDGGNLFLPDNDWFIFSYCRTNVKAEGNDFSTDVSSEINAKIWDRRDDPGVGWVDFRPFIPPAPATAAGCGPLTIASLACVPTAVGAEVAFSLSRPAATTCGVRNIAGRTIKTLRLAAIQSAGPNVVLWDGRSESGCRAPAGQYLVEIVARTDDGQTARRLTMLSLAR
jgi:hypothetical protein